MQKSKLLNNQFVSIFNSNITPNIFGYLFFIVLGIISIWDAYPRILITDPANYLFNIINKSDFFFFKPRYTMVINQGLVVLAVKLNVPLKLLIPIYSFSFVLVRIFYFFLANNVFKNKSAGFAIIAISVIGVAESYFRPTSESTIALLNSCLLFAFLFYADLKNWGKWKSLIQIFGTFLFIIFGYYTHPIAIFSLLFVIVYYSLSTNKFKTLYPYITLVFVIIIFLGKVLLGDNSGHHNSLYANLLSSPITILKELPTYYPYRFFKNHFNQIYQLLTMLFVLGGIMLLIKKEKRISGIFFIFYVLVYFIVACTSFKKGDSNMQMEKIFIPIAMFSAIAFSDALTILFKKNQVLYVFAVLTILIFGFKGINKVRPMYQSRIDYLNEIVEKASREESKKLIIKSDQVDRKMIFTWAMSLETLMFSSIEENIEPLTVYCIQNKENLEGKKDKLDNFIVAHFQTSYQYSRLNNNYFKLPEQKYRMWAMDFKNK